MTPEIILQIERAEALALSVFAEAGSVEEGNPLGVEGTWVGQGYALVHRACPASIMNRAVAVSKEDVPTALAFFRSQGLPPRFDVAGELQPSDGASWMQDHSLELETSTTMARRMVAGSIHRPPQVNSGLQVKLVQPEHLSDFVEIMATGFQMPYLRRPTSADWAGKIANHPSVRVYLAWIGENAVACGLTVVSGTVAYLGNGATLPEYRGRGAQQALINRRVDDAALEGCTLASSFVLAGSGSERNLRRCGLLNFYDREIWMPRGWREHPFYAART